MIDFNRPGFGRLLDPRCRMEFAVLADCTNGVFNGDPDNLAGPRVDVPTGLGYTTDVSTKRILRDTMAIIAGEVGFPNFALYVEHRGVINPKHDAIYDHLGIARVKPVVRDVPDKLAEKMSSDDAPELPEAFHFRVVRPAADDKPAQCTLSYDGSLLAEAKKEFLDSVKGDYGKEWSNWFKELVGKAKVVGLSNDTIGKLNAELCRRYADVALFGAVGSTGNAVGNTKGPMQIGMGNSISPVESESICITTVSVRKQEDFDEGKTSDMGRKAVCPYMLVRWHGFFSPPLAERSLCGPDHLRLFWEALTRFGRYSHSALRGHIELAGCWVFIHDSPLGNAPAHELFSRLRVKAKDGVAHPRTLTDYIIETDGSNMPRGVEMVELFRRAAPVLPPA